MLVRLPLIFCSSAALILACGGKDGGDPLMTTDSGEVGSSGGEEAGAFEPVPARGISITKVTSNQGTEVELSENGVWVDGSARRTFIIAERDSLIRVHFVLEEGWVEREIQARLSLTLPGGTEQQLTYQALVRQNSNEQFLDRTLYFGLIADDGQTQPGTLFHVELWEVAPGGENHSEGLWASPIAGPNQIGFQPEPMDINVMFVPIIYNGSPPDMDDSDRQHVENRVLEHNPLQRVNAQWHEPIVYSQTLSDLGQLLPVMSQLRSNEGFGFSSLYYSAIVETGGGGVGGAAGIAWVVSDQLGEDRVNANVWWQRNSSADTIVHEIGHNQGLSHVFCPNGGAAGPDPNFPDPNGQIQNPGFGIRTFEMHAPTHYDYMSYCGPSWVSPWTWSKTYFRIRSLTDAWAPDVVPNTPVLKGLIYEDGRSEWWTVTGSFDREQVSGHHRLAFETATGRVETLAASGMLTDGKTQWVAAELPVEPSAISTVNYAGDLAQAEVDLAEITFAHQVRPQ